MKSLGLSGDKCLFRDLKVIEESFYRFVSVNIYLLTHTFKVNQKVNQLMHVLGEQFSLLQK
jgi:hypothetical protein